MSAHRVPNLHILPQHDAPIAGACKSAPICRKLDAQKKTARCFQRAKVSLLETKERLGIPVAWYVSLQRRPAPLSLFVAAAAWLDS
jgi:hypothetical protein